MHSIPKRHHYIPTWHLKNFTDSNGICHVYDKETGKLFPSKPEKILKIKNYHTQETPNGVDENILESQISIVEGKAHKAIIKLISKENLTDDDIAMLITHIDYQKLRTPKQANFAFLSFERFLRNKINNNPKLYAVKKALENGEYKLEIKDWYRFNYYNIALGALGHFLMNMNWAIMKVSGASRFIINDNPVMILNPNIPPVIKSNNFEYINDPGIGLAGSRLIMPLDENHLLTVCHNSFGSEINDPMFKMQYGPKEDGLIRVRYGGADDEFVNLINLTVAMYSLRYIVSSEKRILSALIE